MPMTWPAGRAGGSRRRQLGLSMVELMVGITIGLIIVAGASVLLSTQMVDNRRLIAEAQVQQDLRATADTIARELRRAGTIGSDNFLSDRIWDRQWIGSVTEPSANHWATQLSITEPSTGTLVIFNYRPAGAGTEGAPSFGFRHDVAAGVIDTLLLAGGWQPLTDPAVLNVTEFDVTSTVDTIERIPCPSPCADGTSNCWPTVNIRELEILITAAARSALEIVRTHRSRVRIRNDLFQYFNHADDLTAQVCPA